MSKKLVNEKWAKILKFIERNKSKHLIVSNCCFLLAYVALPKKAKMGFAQSIKCTVLNVYTINVHYFISRHSRPHGRDIK